MKYEVYKESLEKFKLIFIFSIFEYNICRDKNIFKESDTI